MSQEKVDKYKKEKYSRKNAVKKKSHLKLIYGILGTIVVLAFIGWIGYSVAVATGIYVPETTKAHKELSKEELESFRQALIDNGDANVQGVTTAASDQPDDLEAITDDAAAAQTEVPAAEATEAEAAEAAETEAK